MCELKAIVQNIRAATAPSLSRPQESPPVSSQALSSDPPPQNTQNESGTHEPQSVNERNSLNNDDDIGFTIARNRPYANAIRRNGTYADPARRASATAGAPRQQASNVRRGRNPPDPGARRNNIIIGNRQNSDSTEFSGGERVFDLYVGGCNTDSSSENIADYCRRNGVVVKNSESLPQNLQWVKSFKISVGENDREKLLKSEFWPLGIYVRKFYRRKTRNDS